MSRKTVHKEMLLDTLKQLYMSLKGISSYPKDHPASMRPIQKSLRMISDLLKKTNVMTISVVHNRLLMHNTPIDGKLEMGIEPFLVASSVDLIIAQRLMRKICPDCREETNPPEMHLDYLKKLGFDVKTTKFHKGKGCSKCNDTGYKGRFAIYEVLPMGYEIREMIINRESIIRIQKKAEALGVKTLQQNGILKVKQGMTTIDELMRAAI